MNRNTVGSFVMKALAILVLFNMIYSTLSYIVNTYDNELDYLIETLGSGWVFAPAIDFFRSMWSWIILLLTDTTALAVILFISLIEEAYSTRWE